MSISIQIRTSLPRAPMCPYCGHGPVVFHTNKDNAPIMTSFNKTESQIKYHPFYPHLSGAFTFKRSD